MNGFGATCVIQVHNEKHNVQTTRRCLTVMLFARTPDLLSLHDITPSQVNQATLARGMLSQGLLRLAMFVMTGAALLAVALSQRAVAASCGLQCGDDEGIALFLWVGGSALRQGPYAS